MAGLINMGAQQRANAANGLNSMTGLEQRRHSTNERFELKKYMNNKELQGMVQGMQALGDERFNQAAQKLMRSLF